MQTPFRPDQDIESYRFEGGAEVILADEVIAFCQSGVSIVFGVRGLDGAPIVGIGVAGRILDRQRCRLVTERRNNRDALLSLTRDSRIAATFTRVPDHRSIQIKGTDAIIAAVQPEDSRAATRQRRHFRDSIVDAGLSDPYAAAFCGFDPADLVGIEFTVSDSYTQTPGPGAGTRLSLREPPR
jgi:hypothetical protein